MGRTRRRRRGHRRKSFRRFKRRGFKRSSMTKPTIRTLRLGKQIVPDVMRLKMSFTHSLTFALTNVTYHETFRANSIYDPWVGLGNISCTGREEWFAFYGLYRVLASKFTVSVTNTSATQTAICALFPSLFTVIPATSADQLASLPYCRSKQAATSGGINRVILKNYISTAKVYGFPQMGIRTNERFTGAMDGNFDPTLPWYWHLVVTSGDAITNLSLQIFVKGDYYVELYGRRNIVPYIPQTDADVEAEEMNNLDFSDAMKSLYKGV